MSGRAAPRRRGEVASAGGSCDGRTNLGNRVRVPTGVVMAPRLTVGIASISRCWRCGCARAQTTKTFIDRPADANHIYAHHERVGLYRDGSTPPIASPARRRSAGHLQRDRELDKPARVLLLGRHGHPRSRRDLSCSPTDGPAPGVQPGWEEFGSFTRSEAQARSNTDKGTPTTARASRRYHHGHNSQVVALLNGTYAMIVSEVVPFTIFRRLLDGPWTCSGSPGSGMAPSSFGGNTNYASNVSLVVRPDGNFGHAAARAAGAQHERDLWSYRRSNQYLSLERGHFPPVQRQHLPQQTEAFGSDGAVDRRVDLQPAPRTR